MAAIIGWNNVVLGATITAGSAALPAANVKGPHGSASTGWQTAAGVVTSGAGATLTVTPTTGAQTWRAMGLFGCNLTHAATVTFQLWNTSGPTLVWSSALSGPVGGYRQVVAIPSSNQVADYLKVLIDDSGNPDGFVNVPLVYGGPAWLPDRGVSFSSTLGRDDSTLETVSRGGQEFPVPLWQRRRWALEFGALTAAELWTQADPLVILAHQGMNVFFAPDATSSYLNQEAIFGRLKLTSDITYPFHTTTRRQMNVTISERL
jgi:hypothetical protein